MDIWIPEKYDKNILTNIERATNYISIIYNFNIKCKIILKIIFQFYEFW
jgi:hypothetical protein